MEIDPAEWKGSKESDSYKRSSSPIRASDAEDDEAGCQRPSEDEPANGLDTCPFHLSHVPRQAKVRNGDPKWTFRQPDPLGLVFKLLPARTFEHPAA